MSTSDSLIWYNYAWPYDPMTSYDPCLSPLAEVVKLTAIHSESLFDCMSIQVLSVHTVEFSSEVLIKTLKMALKWFPFCNVLNISSICISSIYLENICCMLCKSKLPKMQYLGIISEKIMKKFSQKLKIRLKKLKIGLEKNEIRTLIG